MKTLRSLVVLIPATLLLVGACPREQFSMDGINASTASTTRAQPADSVEAAPAAGSSTEIESSGKAARPQRTTPKQRRPLTERSRIWLT